MTDYFTPYTTVKFYALNDEERKYFQGLVNIQRLDFDSQLILWYDYEDDCIYLSGHIMDLKDEWYYQAICKCINNR